jgi:acyl-ACP thioesterase
MEQLYQQEMVIPPSLGDAEGLLAYDRAFALFMDVAAAHSELLGNGVRSMLDRGLFWLTVRSRGRFLRRPRIGEKVTLATWPEQPGKVRVNRSYEIVQQGEVLVAAKTEWTVLDLRTQRVSLVGSLFQPQLTYDLPSACPERFADVSRDYSDAESRGSYRVRSTDIDLGGHMNNAAYLRALLGCFSAAEVKELDIRQIDMVFRAPCYEGDELELRRRPTEAGLDLAFLREGNPAFLARLK